MARKTLSTDVFYEAVRRMYSLYKEGHRIVVSFSGGKDSGVCVEICAIAAKKAGRLPVEVAMRDEEIMFPGTFEYCERMAKRPDIKFDWVIAGQPVINIFNRKNPYFWVFDKNLKPEQWVRQPPPFANYIKEQNIYGLINDKRYPPSPGKKLYVVIGIRTTESQNRRMAIFSSKGYLTKTVTGGGFIKCRPIYDWNDGDIWKSIYDNNWDYNEAYNAMHRLGVAKTSLRIAPPTMASASIPALSLAARAWPRWFDKVCERLPGVRTAAMFGRRAVEPIRRLGETWEECYQRECIDGAPEWISKRAEIVRKTILTNHSKHSNQPFPQTTQCPMCGLHNSWKRLAKIMYMGDPFSQKQQIVPVMEPEFFREGAGYWGDGSPTW